MTMTTEAQQAEAPKNPRYEAHEKAPLLASLGYGLQFSFIASATLLVTPVIVAQQYIQQSGGDDSYLVWMVFASLLVVGVSTLIQVRRVGPIGAGAVLPMFTAAFSIPFCITALVDGGPTTLMALVLVSAGVQIAISRWLFILRRIVTPTVGGTVMMILSLTLASVVFGMLNRASETEPIPTFLTALITLVVVAVLALRGSNAFSLWGPVVGIVVGSIAAVLFGIYDVSRVVEAPWVGLPTSWPGFGLDFGINFWTLLPGFLFLGVIISIQANGASIAMQRVAHREDLAVNFREVQGALAGTGVTNALAGLAGTVPNIINPGAISFTQLTGFAARRVGYVIGCTFILAAFIPKVSGLISTIPSPVMAGYLMMIVGSLFVEGARIVIQTEKDREKVAVAGVCFWFAAPFQFGLLKLPDFHPVIDALLDSGITTGGFAAIAMILYLELTRPRRMRFESILHIDSLPELNEFMARFATRRRWNNAMKERLTAVAEETLLTLAPLDLTSFSLDDDEEEPEEEEKQLVVIASSDGNVAELEFIGGASDEQNIEDRVRQLEQHDAENIVEQELSLQLLQSYTASVEHHQYHGTDIIRVRVEQPAG